jgi:ribokinase
MSVCVLGSLNLDIICRVRDLPTPGETVIGDSVDRLTGGKGANQAIASALYGAPTIMIGALGRDEAAGMLLAHLAEVGVDTTSIAQLDGHISGHGYITVNAAGENMIVVISGANAALTEAHVQPAALKGHTVFLTQLETPLSVTQAVFSGLEARAALTILNAAPALAEGAALFPLMDIIIVNQTEVAKFAGLAKEPETLDAAAGAARRLISRPGQTVVVTLGAAGAAAVSANEAFMVAGLPANVVDTTGAGDCFCGVLAAALSEGADLRTAMTAANAAAGLSTEKPGAAPAMPTRAAIEARLAGRG